MLLLLLNVRTVLRYQRGKSQAVIRRRTDNTIVRRKRTKGQTIIYKTIKVHLPQT
jgi:hypothetical protein